MHSVSKISPRLRDDSSAYIESEEEEEEEDVGGKKRGTRSNNNARDNIYAVHVHTHTLLHAPSSRAFALPRKGFRRSLASSAAPRRKENKGPRAQLAAPLLLRAAIRRERARLRNGAPMSPAARALPPFSPREGRPSRTGTESLG